MKRHSEYFTSILGLLLIFSAFATAQIVETPTLKGAEAVEELKKNGSYDSLLNAVKETQPKDETSTQDFSIGQEVKLIDESGSALEQLGYSVAISGDTMAVGAPFDTITHTNQGSVRIYVRTGTVWSLQATLTSSAPISNANFGSSVDIEGDTLVVGAIRDEGAAGISSGAVYVFTRSGTVWTQESKIIPTSGEVLDEFGTVVKISGGTIAVSAPRTDEIFTNEGAVYAYVKNTSGIWVQQTVQFGSNSESDSECGKSIDLEGDLLLMGCELDDDAFFNQGIVYAYRRNAGVWTMQIISNPETSPTTLFGRAVSISGNSVAVSGSNPLGGKVFVYSFDGTNWVLDTTITEGGPSFGSEINLDGNLLISSLSAEQVGANPNQGAVYVYQKNGGVWTKQLHLTASDGGANDRFGSALDFADGYLAVGVPEETIGGNADQGAVYVNRVLNSNWLGESEFTSSDGAAIDNFGESVAISGDTAVIGAPNDDFGSGFDQGSAYVFVRNGSAWTQQAKLQASDAGSIENFGSSVAIYGDVILVGAPGDDISGLINQGSAYVFRRSGTTWTEEAKFIAADGNADDFFGTSVDIQGRTAVVGARSADGGGAVYIFNRSGGVWSQTNKLVSSDLAANDNFGVSVAISGSWLIVGASLDDHSGFTNIGSAYIFSGAASSWTELAKIIPSDPEGDIRFGVRVDITDDTAIAAATQDTVSGTFQRGSAYIFKRSGAAWTQEAKLTASDGALQDLFGNSVALEGNTAVVGVLRKDISGNNNQGAVYVFERTNGVWLQTNKLFDSDGIAGDNFGTSVAISGTKIIVGTPFANIPAFSPLAGADQGSASIYVNSPAAPTAAEVFIDGRVADRSNNGISNASLTLVNTRTSEVQTVRTNQFGKFRFENLPVGDVYALTIDHKRYRFTTNQQILQPFDNLEKIVFTADE